MLTTGRDGEERAVAVTGAASKRRGVAIAVACESDEPEDPPPATEGERGSGGSLRTVAFSPWIQTPARGDTSQSSE